MRFDHKGGRMIYRRKIKDSLCDFLKNLKKNINNDTYAKILEWAKKIPWKSPRTIGLAFIVLMVFLGSIFYLSTTTSAVRIIVNDKNIGYAPNMNEAKLIVQDVLSKQGEVVGMIAQTSDSIEYKRVRIDKKEYAISKVSSELLLNSITPYIDGCGLRIGEEIAVVLANEQEIDIVLEKYKEYFTKPSEKNVISSSEFVEKFTKEAVKANPNEIISVDRALDILIKGDIAETNYTVQPNDSLWLIARKNNMLTDEVIAGNPGFTEDTVIQPGQEIKLVNVQPYLTVLSKGTKIVNEVIPFDVVTNVDSKLGYGKSIVKQEGKDGEKTVTYKYVEKNGSTMERQVVKEEVITQPVKQIIAKGPNQATVYVGTSRGSGNISGLDWPLSGPITSYYGSRWGSFHTGIDIDGVTGQPYSAAASGKVISAGWAGSYGYSIIIDHGNGVATRYAHSSKLKVSVGQAVNQGETIGLVGSTGRSTGSHLHFEVLINGSTVNPLKHL